MKRGLLGGVAILLLAAGALLVSRRAEESKSRLKAGLTPEQFKVVRLGGTETPFKNAYWDNHAPGIYVDIVSGEPLFSSTDKFDSGTGWPSFTKPLEPENVVQTTTGPLALLGAEVHSRQAASHLGHVFNDGPRAEGGLRYCINSASLRFIHLDDLEAEGYGEYKKLFTNQEAQA